jgi:hypothetical protein
MKNLIIFLIAIGLILTFLTADAQSKREKTNNENVGDRIGYEADKVGNELDKVGNNIDNTVNKIVKRWTSPFDEEQITEEDTIESKSHISPNITDSEIDSNAQSFSGDKVIERSETIDNNIIVKGGDLTIYGTVNGDVLVVGGDLHMKRTGKITGSARVVNGSILKEDGAIIGGFEDFTRKEKSGFRPSRRNFSRTVRSFDVPWLDEQMNLDNFIFRYNRVEGLFLGLSS